MSAWASAQSLSREQAREASLTALRARAAPRVGRSSQLRFPSLSQTSWLQDIKVKTSAQAGRSTSHCWLLSSLHNGSMSCAIVARAASAPDRDAIAPSQL